MIKKLVILTVVLASLVGFAGHQYLNPQVIASDDAQLAKASKHSKTGNRRMWPNPFTVGES